MKVKSKKEIQEYLDCEKTVLGKSILGCGSDMMKWVENARFFLHNHNKGIFFNQPENDFEADCNLKKFNELKLEQVAMVDEFLQMNEEILTELQSEIFVKKDLAVEDLRPYLNRVLFPKGFPQPNIETQQPLVDK